MRKQHLRGWLAASVLGLGAGLARGAVQNAEDLTGCQLPNGRAVLPLLATALASNGTIFKFSTGEFSALPVIEDGKVLSSDQSIAKIQSAKLGDLQYMVDSKDVGSLWAFSGCVTNVPGVVTLAGASGKKLDEPGLLIKTSKTFAGQLPDVEEGVVYLVKTVDGRFALLRILEQTRDALIVQYVYQPDGTASFIIPAHRPVLYVRPNDAQTAPAAAAASAPASAPAFPTGSSIASVAPIPTGVVDPLFAGMGAGGGDGGGSAAAPATNRTTLTPAPPTVLGPDDINDPKERVIRIVGGPGAVLPPQATPRTGSGIVQTPAPITGAPIADPALDAFVQQRTQMIQRRLGIVGTPAKSPQEIERKSQAILELGYLHADDPAVADALVSEIAFVNTRTPVREFSPDATFPCLAALKRLGKPATAAALRGLHQLNLDTPDGDLDSPVYKVKLLANVIRAIEGDDVADFIFRREAAKETDPKRKAVFEYLLNNQPTEGAPAEVPLFEDRMLKVQRTAHAARRRAPLA